MKHLFFFLNFIVLVACLFPLVIYSFVLANNRNFLKDGYNEYNCPIFKFNQKQSDAYNSTIKGVTTHYPAKCNIDVVYACGNSGFTEKTKCDYSQCTNETIELCKNQTDLSPLKVFVFNKYPYTLYTKQDFDKEYQSRTNKKPIVIISIFSTLIVISIAAFFVFEFWNFEMQCCQRIHRIASVRTDDV